MTKAVVVRVRARVVGVMKEMWPTTQILRSIQMKMEVLVAAVRTVKAAVEEAVPSAKPAPTQGTAKALEVPSTKAMGVSLIYRD
jgi:hypothetical protein